MKQQGKASVTLGGSVHDAWDVAAIELTAKGISIFPCGENKRPTTEHGFLDASIDPEVIRNWREQKPRAYIGVPTGEVFLVVDIDPKGGSWYAANRERLDCRRMHHTRRGRHLLYRMPSLDIRSSANKIAPGVDVRAKGGYVIWWPAHGFGVEGAIEDLTDPPQWLIGELTRGAATTAAPESVAIVSDGTIAEGGRNDYLSREAFRMRKQGASVEQTTLMLLAVNRVRCTPPLPDEDVRKIAEGKAAVDAEPQTVTADDFFAYMPMHLYIFAPNRDLWPAASVNARLPRVVVSHDKEMKASDWLDRHRAVDQMTWAPGLPMVVENRLISNGGWIERPGSNCFNSYLPPQIEFGDASAAEPWRKHIRRVYGDDAEHMECWFAHRVQRPQEKVNHALVLGGGHGIGKDTMLEPLKYAVGPWNFSEVSPKHLLGRFNGFVKSVILRVSEARDLGDVDRYAFYDHMKVYTAAPPDVLRCDEKNIREHAIVNVCGVIITTNYKTDGIYLPDDDRRHFVAWSDLKREDFESQYWIDLWTWYATGGLQHVAAYLATKDISRFDAKAPPPKTAAFYAIVDAGRAPEDSELADAIDKLGRPDAVTIRDIANSATEEFSGWLLDRRNRRMIPHRLEESGYVPVRNGDVKDGQWVIEGRRQAIYAKRELSTRDQVDAARRVSQRF